MGTTSAWERGRLAHPHLGTPGPLRDPSESREEGLE